LASTLHSTVLVGWVQLVSDTVIEAARARRGNKFPRTAQKTGDGLVFTSKQTQCHNHQPTTYFPFMKK
jgi:hypothetical protein